MTKLGDDFNLQEQTEQMQDLLISVEYQIEALKRNIRVLHTIATKCAVHLNLDVSIRSGGTNKD